MSEANVDAEGAPKIDTKPAPDAGAETEAITSPATPAAKRETVVRREALLDHGIGAAIGAVYVGWLLATARSLGFSRDEGFYFHAAGEYERWFKLLLTTPAKALERSAIDASWATNHEHPSLMKSLFALSHLYLHQKWKVFDDASTAFRFPGMLSMAAALWVTFLFARRAWGSRRAGIAAACALAFLPRVFYHAHLACFDVPIMAMWTLCIYVYWRATVEGGLGWAVAAGVMYGLTLETKHNAWMLPAVFLVHAVIVHGRAASDEASRSGRIPVPASLLAMATIGPAVFVGLWPWLWNDTLARFQEYLNFHLHHDYYNIEFLGVTWFAPPSPRSYMPVMIFATVPTVTLGLGLVGALAAAWRFVVRAYAWAAEGTKRALPARLVSADPHATDALLLLSMCVPLAVFLLPRTPIFGGTKHWIPAYPFLAIFAGWAFDRAATRLEIELTRRRRDARTIELAAAAFGAFTFLAPFAITRHSHPFGLTSYVPAVGGTQGAASLGLNRQFWGFTTQSLAGYFEAEAWPGARVYIMDTSWPSWQRMVDEGRLPKTLRGVGSPSEADFAIVHHEQHMNEVDYNIWTDYGTTSPDYVLTHDGVPVISVYRNPRTHKPSP